MIRGPKTTRKLLLLLPGVVIALWLVLAAVGGPYFGKISDVASTDLSTFLPENSESTKVNNELSKFRDTQIIPALAVFDTNKNELTASDMQAIEAARQQVSGVHGVRGDISPALVSEDKKAAFMVLPLESNGDFKEIFKELRSRLDGAGLPMEYKLTGPASLAHDLQGAFEGIDMTLLLVALCVVFVILLVVYRSPFLPFIVLLTAMSALAVAIFAVYHLADAGVVRLNGQVQGILFILVIGAATDYALLYISRYREELSRHERAWTATKAALKASYEPILAAGGTVTIGLLCLLFSGLGSNRALGPVGGIGIALSVAAALTLLPAILLLFGRKAFWPRPPKLETGKASQDYMHLHTAWSKVGRLVRRHPRRIWALTLVGLIIACLAVPQLKAEGVAQSNLVLGYSEAREGQKILNEHFPSGSGSPTYVLLEAQKTNTVIQKVRANNGVASVIPLFDTPTADPAQLRSAVPKIVDGKAILQVTLKEAPDSFAAREVVVQLREEVKTVDEGALVGGTTAIQYDTNKTSLRDQYVVIPLILAAITIILMALLRSIVAPVVLLLTTVLSFGATLGISALLFNHVWDFPGADPSVIIFGFVFLVALGIDYNIFLMSRVKEETLHLGVHAGTIKGLVVTGGVITSAGVVLAATFAALSVIPIMFLAQIAFIVAFGVLLDTIVVRSLLVPALTLQMGKRMWWPSKIKD